MATLSELQARLEAAQKVYDSLVQSSQHGESRIQFVDVEKQTAVIADIQRRIAAASGTSKPRVRYVYQTSRGY